MLYVCIPVHNEATTIGVLLWRIRTVLQEYTREYEVVVYDDGSTDATAEVLEPYRRVLPLTVLRAPGRRGVAHAVDALCRHVIAHTRYPRRDAVVLMQGDFTDRPEDLPELAKRFEGGADLVIGRRPASLDQPQPERRLRQLAPWVLRPFVRVAEVEDLLTAFRLVRVSVLRDLSRTRGDALLAEGDGWAATVDFALAVAPYARRVDVVDLPGRYDLRPRASRLDWWRELRGLAGYAWRARGLRVSAGERIGGERGGERGTERAPERLPERGDVAVIGSVSALAAGEDGPRVAERGDAERPGRATREKRRPERLERAERGERPTRVERPERPERTKRAPEAVESEAPRKRGKPGRAEPRESAASVGEDVTAEFGEGAVAPAPAVRPPRAERAARRAERTAPESAEPRSAAARPATGDDATSDDGGLAQASVALPEGAAEGGEESLEAGVRRKARRRRRRSRGKGAAAESNESADSSADAGDEAVGELDGGGEEAVAPREDAAGGEDVEGPEDGMPGEDAPRKRSRRRRRGRGRSERADGAPSGGASGADDAGGGTDAPGGVGERTTGLGVAAPRPSEPDPAAD
ncbi:MAG: glycosyltransferase [Gemmatirosa sp.]